MSGAVTTTPGDWRNFSTHFPIAACRLTTEGLKLLYRLIDERQKEYGDKVVAQQTQQPNETLETFTARKSTVSGAFITSVTVTAKNGETITANNERIFDQGSFPTELRSVFYSTISIPQAVLNHRPVDRITVFLDFSQPPAIDLSRLPTLATPNESNFEIGASNEAWFVLSKARLTEFFRERRASYDWIHAAGMYDGLLFVFGLPLAVWGCAKLHSVFPFIDNLNVIPRALIYCYVFLASLSAFRVIFSYPRWIFPKMEIETDTRRSPFRHRAAWTAAVSALFWPAVYDFVKLLISHAR